MLPIKIAINGTLLSFNKEKVEVKVKKKKPGRPVHPTY